MGIDSSYYKSKKDGKTSSAKRDALIVTTVGVTAGTIFAFAVGWMIQ